MLTSCSTALVLRSSALKLSQRLAARGSGAGMGGGGHANNPTFMFQADWQKNGQTVRTSSTSCRTASIGSDVYFFVLVVQLLWWVQVKWHQYKPVRLALCWRAMARIVQPPDQRFQCLFPSLGA